MARSFRERVRAAFNVFTDDEDRRSVFYEADIGSSTSIRPNIFVPFSPGFTMTEIYAKMAVDVSSADVRHVRVNEDENYLETLPSELNQRFAVSSNIDQTPRAFLQDVAMVMFREGAVAIVPVDTSAGSSYSAFDILSLRAASIVGWYPRHVRVSVYDDRAVVGGQRREILLPKERVAVIYNPFYDVMNGPNSTLKRITRKISLLDMNDERLSANNLDVIVSLPYALNSAGKLAEANKRRTMLEQQLTRSIHGIAYIDSTEKVTQLNRPANNALADQIDKLIPQLYSQLGISQAIMDGSADDQTLLNYMNRTIEPVVAAIVDAMNRTFLTKTARTQGHRVQYFTDPFKFITMSQLGEFAPNLINAGVISPNDVRSVLRMKPSEQPGADELSNKNINPVGSVSGAPETEDGEAQADSEEDSIVQDLFNSLEGEITRILQSAGTDDEDEDEEYDEDEEDDEEDDDTED